ncbi:preprotein translocase subunit SecD [Streptomyces sp. SAS_270]|uniref:preprotein translocase subunit SecD n=1 Tax=Streptomyces sp. SAS_270 TaxID=3412748 RepID=UPI00403C9D81
MATQPGDSQEALKSLGRTAELGFRPVLGQTAVKTKDECRAPVPATPDAFTACGQGDNALTKYVLEAVAVPGTDVSDAKATYDKNQGAGWMVQLKFTAAGSKRFGDVTGRLAKQQSPANQFAIVLDDTVLSAPTVAQALTGGNAEISGNFTQRSAQELAAQLDTGALPVQLKVSSVTRLPVD